jgi:colanic acid biosynthesis glycosyl transferase WcaI
VVVEVQDLWPESLAATGMADHHLVLRVVGAMARFVYRHSDVVIAQSEGFRAAIIERGADPARVVVIYNWAHESVLSEPGTPCVVRLASADRPGEVHVLYAGNLGPAQDLDLVLDAAAMLQTDGDAVRIHLMGTGQSEQLLRARVTAEGLGNVTFHAQQPRDVVGPVLGQADALLVILKDDPLFRITVPSKTQSSLAAGRPLLMAVAGEAAGLVEQSGGGVVVPPGDAVALVAGIRQIASVSVGERDAMGSAGRRYYLERLSLAAGADATVQAVNLAIRSHRG